MKMLRLIPLLFLVAGMTACTKNPNPETVVLTDAWKFSTGDQREWAMPSFNDAAWGSIDPTRIWESQGFSGYNGIAWYRTRAVIPSTLKEQVRATDSLQFFLGKIDDCDQVYLNGELIGENTKNVPAKVTVDSNFTKARYIWNIERRYTLALNDPRIKWDEENLIAVRCYDHGGDGGMFSDRFEIRMTSLEDRILFDLQSHPFVLEDSTASKKLVIRNLSGSDECKGELFIRVHDPKTGITIYSEKAGILLTPGIILEKVIRFRHEKSAPVTMTVEIRESSTGQQVLATAEVPYILTPEVSPMPRINGAKIFGVRPYSPFLYKVAATGLPPLKYEALDLPAGLTIHPSTGMITGMLKKKGEYLVKLKVSNGLGVAVGDFRIVVGDLISLTPPMGWNSWNCWGLSVSDSKVRESAAHMVSSGLIDHGWTYINIDDGWQDTHDRDGNILPNSKFPDMKRLSDHVHSLGLKIGIYSSPGPLTCGGYEGSYRFEENDARTYSAWGMDYLKYDWCSYFQIAPDPTPEQLKKPYREMRHALRKANRDIHYSLCQYGMGDVWTWGAEVDGNSWRTTGDITDTWESLRTIGFSQSTCSPWAGPGRWNDPDMLVVGWVGWGPSLHYTKLNPHEQYTHMTLWSLLASPLLIGCDLSQLDEFTLNLLTNDEVLEVNQDPLGQQAERIYNSGTYQVWARDLADGRKAVGLFNLTGKPMYVPVDMKALCLEGKWMLRDIWSQKDMGLVRSRFEMLTQPHGARFVVLSGI